MKKTTYQNPNGRIVEIYCGEGAVIGKAAAIGKGVIISCDPQIVKYKL